MTLATSTNLNLPLLLVGGLLTLAALTYVFRQWERFICLIAAFFLGGVGLWLWQIDGNVPLHVLPFLGLTVDLGLASTRANFTFQLQAVALPTIVSSLLLGSGALFLAARVSQGRTFIPFTLLLLAGYLTLALTVAGPLPMPLLTPLALIALNCIGVFVLQAGRLTSPSGPLRTLLPPVLAFPFFLVAGWYLDQLALNPQDVTTTRTAGTLLGLGMLLLLSPVPLHSAHPVSSRTAPPVVSALVTLLYQLALLQLFFRLTRDYPFVLNDSSFGEWLQLGGLATAVWGGIAAAGASHAGLLLGYAALHDWGLIILMLAVPGVRSLSLVLVLFGLRAVSMLTAASGLSMLEHHLGGLRPVRLQGAGSRLPWNSAAFLLGGLGLVGFPLSAGFTGHWSALQTIAENDWLPAVIVLLSSGGAVFGFVRMARLLFGRLENRFVLREQPFNALLAVLILLLSVGLAIMPQLLNVPVSRVLAAFSG